MRYQNRDVRHFKEIATKEECLERLIFFGEAPVRNAISEFLIHYHSE